MWQQGSLVRHNQCLYRAEGISNVAEPGKNADIVFYVSILLSITFIFCTHFVEVLVN